MAKHKDSEEVGTPLLERATSMLGAALAIGIVGFILWEGFANAEKPARIRVEFLRGYAVPTGHALEFVAVNDGGEPAAEVTVGGRGADGELSAVTFDFVPADSSRRGVIVLDAPPDGAPVLRVLGYREP